MRASTTGAARHRTANNSRTWSWAQFGTADCVAVHAETFHRAGWCRPARRGRRQMDATDATPRDDVNGSTVGWFGKGQAEQRRWDGDGRSISRSGPCLDSAGVGCRLIRTQSGRGGVFGLRRALVRPMGRSRQLQPKRPRACWACARGGERLTRQGRPIGRDLPRATVRSQQTPFDFARVVEW